MLVFSYERVLMLQGSEGREQPFGHARTLWACKPADGKLAFLGKEEDGSGCKR